ncbi:MAG: cytidine deaminase [Anaerolineae bacterium]
MSSPDLRRVERLPQPWRDLITAATRAREHAYAPYSRFAVGAAVLTGAGCVFTGCNIENASLGLTVCAERVAIWKAVSEGERALQALAIVTDVGATPCGACRQVIAEFADDLDVLVANLTGDIWVFSQVELLRHSFPQESLRTLLGPVGGSADDSGR